MNDIITTCVATETREHMIRRLSMKCGFFHWHFNPRREVDRLYLVHQNQLVGWMKIAEVIHIPDGTPLRYPDGEVRRVRGGYWLRCAAPINLLDPMPACRGFRGFRYFDMESFERGACGPIAPPRRRAIA